MAKFSVLLMVSATLFAQETWNGLKFGMTQSATREAMHKLGLSEIEKTPDKNSGPDRTLYFSGFKIDSLPLEVGAYFGANTTLQTIYLRRVSSLEDRNGRIEAWRATDLLRDKLTAKYGNPTTSKGECVPNASMLLEAEKRRGYVAYSCDALWVRSDQAIRLSWFFFSKGFKLYVEYKPQTKGL
jgi:hypothetical protein